MRDYRDDRLFDAIVGRLILFHLEDPAAVVRHHAAALKPGGLIVAVDFDIGACRTEPPAALADAALEFLLPAFRGVGANPVIGVQLASILQTAGLADISSYGIQVYLLPGDRRAPLLLAGIVRTLAAATGGAGLPPELEPLETLEQRLADDLLAAGAVILFPALVGAWGRS